MSDETVKIQITEDEWAEYPEEKRKRIMELIEENYGWDVSSLLVLEEGSEMVCPYCDDEGCDVCEEDVE